MNYYQQPQYNISALVDRYAMPYLLGFIEGRTEKEYHELMRRRPDFVAEFRDRNRLAWSVVMGVMKQFRGRINLSPDYEARKVALIIKRRGWRCYKSEYFCFRDNIARFLAFANG
jgi:hypothetical protein